MTRMGCITLLALLTLQSVLAAATIDPLPGWVKADKLDKVLEYAKAKGRPIAFLHTFKTSDCPICTSDSRKYMREKSLAGTARVILYAEEPLPEAFRTVAKQVKRPDNVIPVVYIATPELEVIGFARSGTNTKDLKQIVALSRKIMTWRKKAAKNISKADALVEGGRFKAATTLYEKVLKLDRKYTRMVHKTWGEKLDKDAVTPKYFAKAAETLAGLEKQAETRLEKATEHFENKAYAEAEKLLTPMVSDGADFEAVRKARELLTKVKAARKA